LHHEEDEMAEQLIGEAPAPISEALAEKLRSRLGGDVVAPGDVSYDEARSVWNGMIDRRPALIARCSGTADVVHTVRFARENELPVTVRGGGHGVGGHAVRDEALMIDLSAMKGIWVDAARRSAHAQAGVLLGELDHETQLFGLAAPAGVVTHTGIAGLTLGGGIGWLMRKHGLTIDNVTSFDVVTAEGEAATASKDSNPDLFWGLRGGGGNFGIVTSFEYALQRVGPDVLAGPVLFPAEQAGEVLRFYRDFIADAPDEVGTILNLRYAPAAPYLPEHVHGQAVVMIAVCFAGPIDEARKVLRPLLEYGDPLANAVEPRPFTNLQGMFDASVPHGQRYYWKSEYLGELSDQALDTLAAHAWKAPSKKSYSVMFHMGGAVQRFTDSDTAFHGRTAKHALNINGVWTEPAGDDQETAWARAFWTAVQPFSTGVYVNFLGDEGDDRIKVAYGAEKYKRLVELKRKYDPDNFFRSNQNIRPGP
jgi:FAD/FMN-containing dehydrogenase